jgi:hypothetical protein
LTMPQPSRGICRMPDERCWEVLAGSRSFESVTTAALDELTPGPWEASPPNGAAPVRIPAGPPPVGVRDAQSQNSGHQIWLAGSTGPPQFHHKIRSPWLVSDVAEPENGSFVDSIARTIDSPGRENAGSRRKGPRNRPQRNGVPPGRVARRYFAPPSRCTDVSPSQGPLAH